MAPGIRGHMGQFRILKDGQVVDIIEITKASIKMDNSFMRDKYVGKSVPVGDQSIDGWSGSITCNVVDSKIEDFIDAIVSSNLAGIGVEDYAFVMIENYPDGSSISYLYSDCQWSYARENGSYDEKITKTLDFQASFRQKI